MQEKKRIWLSSPHMSEEGFEMEFIKEAFDTNWVAPVGPHLGAFEREFTEMVGAGYGKAMHAVALSSGTAAIHMALKAAGVGKGDTVLCPTLTFSASANPILYEGATPVFIDSDDATWNMDPGALAEALERYPQAKAVIVVHLYGIAADLDAIIPPCRERGITVIEDAAESLGTTYRGKQTGTFGDYGAFSFNGNKIITTSGGGMLVSGDAERIEKVRFWSTQSRDPARHYEHSEPGYNYRMSNVLAGIGRGQLKVLDRRISQKRYIFDFYRRELSGIEGIRFMPVNGWNEPNFWLSCMTVEGVSVPEAIMDALEGENIESRPVWKPMHMQPVFAECDYIGGDMAERIFTNGICLPSDTKMNDGELERVCEKVRATIKAEQDEG